MSQLIDLKEIPGILSYGFMGLGFLLALLTFFLLLKLINDPSHRRTSVLMVLVFMAFSLSLAGGGAYLEIVSKDNARRLAGLEAERSRLAAENSTLSNTVAETQTALARTRDDLTRMKSRKLVWDYVASGDFLQCRANGQAVGVRIDCKDVGTCGKRELSRAVCAYRYAGVVPD